MDDMFVGGSRTAFQLLALLATVLSALLLSRELRTRARSHRMRGSRTPPLRDLPRSGTPVLVDGNAVPGPSGPLVAPYSGTRCVWYRTEVWDHRPAEDSHHERLRVTLVHTEQSEAPFRLRDRTGSAWCHPRGAVTDKVDLTHDSFVVDPLAEGAFGRTEARRELRPEHAHSSAGRSYREWAVAPGTRLLVNGTAYEWNGETLVASSCDGYLLLSTRTAPQLYDAHLTRQVLAGAAFLGSLALTLWLS
ncbi:GIDE domain-containing protein [Nocardiopsis sp. HUAS JQ3]|uniref:GIDE domain-containing protein n=1 Tax=Nocardiopsis sp. HUAS JQ3 TaxID=3061629 RepID=UPI0023A939D3|nr:GIDE domain-containing protein [Nocardiopsis sp. HUAS JQ3]WDZ93399.1 GIDE domain-containing protein [Nocardiopsis sp. HUAS JQ3]